MSETNSLTSSSSSTIRPFDDIIKDKRPHFTIYYKFNVPDDISEELKTMLTNVWYYIFLSPNASRSKLHEHLINLGVKIKRNEMVDLKKYIKYEFVEHKKIEGIEDEGGILIKKYIN